METKYVICNKETKEFKTLTKLEMDRFFYNRNPDDWLTIGSLQLPTSKEEFYE